MSFGRDAESKMAGGRRPELEVEALDSDGVEGSPVAARSKAWLDTILCAATLV